MTAVPSAVRATKLREPLDLAEIAEWVLVSRYQEAARRGLEIRASLDSAPTTGDPVLIESLVTNLLDNAIQHNVSDGIVELVTGRLSAASQLSVRNTGPIVPTAQVDGLFQAFQRLGHDRTRSGDGHGLGLAIVQAIAQAHHALVTAQPRPQGGLDIGISFCSPPDTIAVMQ